MFVGCSLRTSLQITRLISDNREPYDHLARTMLAEARIGCAWQPTTINFQLPWRMTMKRFKVAYLAALSFLFVCGTSLGQQVHIPDPNLRAVLREHLQVNEITEAILSTRLIDLDARDRGITDLTGLEFAAELIDLNISLNPITDLTPLKSLAKLTYLAFWGTPSSNLEPLVGLVGLQVIDANECRISDLTPLANLHNLIVLSVRDNEIKSVAPLAGLTELRELFLHYNQITDVTPLANLTNLRVLQIERNDIVDHSPLDGLSLTLYTYDQDCDLPPVPLTPRLENRKYPSVFTAWGGIGWSSVLNKQHLSDLEQMALHDLYFCCLIFNESYFDTGNGLVLRGRLDEAIALRDEYHAVNPNMIFIAEIRMHGASWAKFPMDSPYWVRDDDGELVLAGGRGLIDFTHPDVQELIIRQAVAIGKCGLYDGIMFDWWNEYGSVLDGTDNEGEQRARDNIIRGIRDRVRPDFLILVNTNRRKVPRNAYGINGSFMESFVPYTAMGVDITDGFEEIRDALGWLDTNLREPRINSLEGWGNPNQPPDSPANLQYMRAITTLSLTHSNGYVMYNTGVEHEHFWYDFWDADLGRPVGEKAQVYDGFDGLYIREFMNGWAVYNQSGAAHVVTLPEKVRSVASGLVNTEHAVLNLDGAMFLKEEMANPVDVNKDGVINILDLVFVAESLGKDDPKADVNGDGLINVFDLVLIANEL